MNNPFSRRFALQSMAAIATAMTSVGCAPESAAAVDLTTPTADGSAVAVLAGGCFWCTEAVFERMKGIQDVESGYIGGSVANPTYNQVCSGLTGHAEAVRIIYDPQIVDYDEILKVFFKTHDPTTLNRQGVDTGTQYRSAIFPVDDEQKQVAEKTISKLNQSDDYRDQIVTTVEPLATWYPAEEYHQDYFRRNPNAGYCKSTVAAKVRKFNREFGKEYLAK